MAFSVFVAVRYPSIASFCALQRWSQWMQHVVCENSLHSYHSAMRFASCSFSALCALFPFLSQRPVLSSLSFISALRFVSLFFQRSALCSLSLSALCALLPVM